MSLIVNPLFSCMDGIDDAFRRSNAGNIRLRMCAVLIELTLVIYYWNSGCVNTPHRTIMTNPSRLNSNASNASRMAVDTFWWTYEAAPSISNTLHPLIICSCNDYADSLTLFGILHVALPNLDMCQFTGAAHWCDQFSKTVERSTV